MKPSANIPDEPFENSDFMAMVRAVGDAALKQVMAQPLPLVDESKDSAANALHPLELLSMRGGPMTGDSDLDPATMPVNPSWMSSDELKRRVVDSLLQNGKAKTREEAVQMFEDEWE